MSILRQPLHSALRHPFLTTSVLTAVLLGVYKKPLLSPATRCKTAHLHTSSAAMAPTNSSAFLDAVAARHSIYALTDKSPIPNSRIREIVEQTQLTVPSAFNSQPIRAVALFGAEHQKFWAAAIAATEKSSTDAEHVQRSVGRINSFQAGVGTVLYFNDEALLEQSRKNIPAYASFFGEWAQHAQGMHHFALWTALNAEGLGANLQHYQFLGEEFVAGVRKEYGLPEDWHMTAQLVFGGRASAEPAQAKEKKDLKETTRFFGE